MKQEAMMKMLMENALEIMIVFDSLGSVVKYNRRAEEALGYSGNMRELSIAGILRKDFENGGQLEDVINSLAGRKEAIIYRDNGTCFQAGITFSYNEETEQYFLFALNLESNREMEQEVVRVREIAVKAQEVKNEFVANVTHELRTPVNGIKGHVENLKDTHLTTEQRKTLNIIERCCDNMSALISSILDFSKLQAGKIQLEMEKFEFREMMEHVTETNMAAVNEKGLQLSVNIDEKIPRYVIGDELRLMQVLNNLISNAIKFTLVGFIRVEVTLTLQFKHEIELFFMVTDSGIGISGEEQESLFKSFSQADASITRKYGGTGLGLAITKELVEMMKGNVYLESEKGRGSNFSFSVRLQTAKQDGTREKYKKEILKILEERRIRGESGRIEECYSFGTEVNTKEIDSRMEKIILSIELEAWEKAESWAGELKSFIKDSHDDVRKALLKLEMAIRKENYDLSVESHEKLKQILKDKSDGTGK